jgi:hypothetical protein
MTIGTVTNGVSSALDDLASDIAELHKASAKIDAYLERPDKVDLDKDKLSPEVKTSMARYLNKLPLGERFYSNDDAVEAGDYDEYFALAFEHALKKSSGEQDPIFAIRNRESLDWDFKVDKFETTTSQGILRQNIQAAGALDYVYVLGDKLGIFRLVDALMLRWSAREIDVPDGEISDMMYSYYKLSKERLSSQDRARSYKQVLAKGGAELMDRAVANEHFPRLWSNLMEAFADYIGKLEGANDEGQVSRTPVYEATRELQVNLTENMTGLAVMEVREMYPHLQAAMKILRHPKVVASIVGGRRLTEWAVIETLSREEFGVAPNVSALKSEAFRGNDVFEWIANFDASTVTNSAFRKVRESAESYIIAQASLGDSDDSFDEDEDDDFDSEEDDFEDF